MDYIKNSRHIFISNIHAEDGAPEGRFYFQRQACLTAGRR